MVKYEDYIVIVNISGKPLANSERYYIFLVMVTKMYTISATGIMTISRIFYSTRYFSSEYTDIFINNYSKSAHAIYRYFNKYI